MIEREWKKRGKCIFFPQLEKSMHIFPPIDLKFTKLQKKRLTIFYLRRAPPHYINFHLGKKQKSKRGGGANMNLIYTTPWGQLIHELNPLKTVNLSFFFISIRKSCTYKIQIVKCILIVKVLKNKLNFKSKLKKYSSAQKLLAIV